MPVETRYVIDTSSVHGLKIFFEEAQGFYTVQRELRVKRSAMTGLYETLLWSLQNFEISEGSQDYIRGNLRALGMTEDLPLAELVFDKIANPNFRWPEDVESARGGEVEFALRSLLDIFRRAKTRRRTEAVETINGYLAELIEEFEKQRIELGQTGMLFLHE